MHPQFNRFELENFSKTAAQTYLDDGVDLNDTITKMAEEHELNGHQIERVVQNANTLVNGALVTRARDDGGDPRVAFAMAKTAEIVGRLENDGTRDLYKAAEVRGLFTLPAPPPPNVLDRVLGKVAATGDEGPRSVDHMELAAVFVRDPATADKVAAHVTAQTLGLACQTLEDAEARATGDHGLCKVAMDGVESELRDEIHDQVLSGTSPATIRDVVKAAGLDGKVEGYVNGLVTKVASRLRAREGHSAFADGALVNRSHTLVSKSAAVTDVIADAGRKRAGLEKFAGAHQAARVHYARAVREGR